MKRIITNKTIKRKKEKKKNTIFREKSCERALFKERLAFIIWDERVDFPMIDFLVIPCYK